MAENGKKRTKKGKKPTAHALLCTVGRSKATVRKLIAVALKAGAGRKLDGIVSRSQVADVQANGA